MGLPYLSQAAFNIFSVQLIKFIYIFELNFSMRIINKLSFFIFSLFLLASCDVIEGPYGTGTQGGGGGQNDEAVSRVLIEDFTGHKCGNCPRAAERIQELQNLYGDRVIAIAVHVGFFATPSSTGLFTADYRTPIGNEIDQYYGNSVAGLPNGLVNRSANSGNTIIDVNAWPSRVVNVLNQEPKLKLNLTGTFTTANRTANASLKIDVLSSMTEQLKVIYYLTEDSILGSQKDYSLSNTDIPEYYHRHVLRGSMNGAWGQDLPNGPLVLGSNIEHSATFTIPEAWKQNKIAVVAVVYNAENREIIEVVEKKLTIQ
jgi:thiol-disulfide isomerase/thioredoxin